MTDTISVSQLNNYISAVLEFDENLANISVTGELSNVKSHTSGHIYFTLKDEESRISGVIFRGQAYSLKFRPKDGMKVVVNGRISVYSKGGTYQIVANSITKAGEGNLYENYLRLMEDYRKMGYFDSEIKKPLPFFPEKIALVTSPTGAAVRDMISVISRRNTAVKMIVCPVKVQGVGAASEIGRMIDYINLHDIADLIITGRGGGSIEELWAFNEPEVIESVHNSRIPVISAVGHETDFTICDFTADVRAATPSVAAELAVFDLEDMRYTVSLKGEKLSSILLSKTEIPKRRISDIRETILPLRITKVLEKNMMNVDKLTLSMNDKIGRLLEGYKNRILMSKALIESSSVENTLKRGFWVLTDKSGNVSSGEKLTTGSKANFVTSGMEVSADITEIRKKYE
ncbi:MAG: exodeoxyribonuclease VII large subunit [Eubacteriaceae bacterium]|nr:exodeoxyribonuclease VII large subunit [Eubacteriaceae bacterium]